MGLYIFFYILLYNKYEDVNQYYIKARKIAVSFKWALINIELTTKQNSECVCRAYSPGLMFLPLVWPKMMASDGLRIQLPLT